MKPSTTQQINAYVSSQQLLHRRLQFLQAIKKADRTRQDVSAFNKPVINLTKVDYINQLTHGVNQYATV